MEHADARELSQFAASAVDVVSTNIRPAAVSFVIAETIASPI